MSSSLHAERPRDTAPNSLPSGEALLDNPILNSLVTDHGGLAMAAGVARRFPANIGPLSGIPDQSAESYEDLRCLAGPGGVIGLFLDEAARPPGGWTLVRGGKLDQMVCHGGVRRADRLLPLEAEMRRLNADDAHMMVELAKLTEPGPFQIRTHELGCFFGIFHGCRLMAMAGQRLKVPGFVEVSAVCTGPEARGRGYAAALMSTVMEEIRAQGRTPFLHSYTHNANAIAVYRGLGFTRRRGFELAVLRNDL